MLSLVVNTLESLLILLTRLSGPRKHQTQKTFFFFWPTQESNPRHPTYKVWHTRHGYSEIVANTYLKLIGEWVITHQLCSFEIFQRCITLYCKWIQTRYYEFKKKLNSTGTRDLYQLENKATVSFLTCWMKLLCNFHVLLRRTTSMSESRPCWNKMLYPIWVEHPTVLFSFTLKDQ